MESVECSECGNRYDSDEEPFCPRCGSEAQGPVQAAMVSARRRSPQRRRVQMAGIVLVVFGSIYLLGAVLQLFAPPIPSELDFDAWQDVPFIANEGGDLLLHLHDNGTGVPGALVQVYAMNGTLLHESRTSASGWSNFTGLPAAFVNVTVTDHGQTWIRHAFVAKGAALEVPVDTAHDDPGEVAWVATPIAAMRYISAFLAGFALLILLGGVAALRLRWKVLSFAGLSLATVPPLVLLYAMPNLVSLLQLGLIVMAWWFLWRGRGLFKGKQEPPTWQAPRQP